MLDFTPTAGFSKLADGMKPVTFWERALTLFNTSFDAMPETRPCMQHAHLPKHTAHAEFVLTPGRKV